MDIVSGPGIAAIVWGMIAMFGGPVPATWKPAVAGALGIGWALLAFFTLAAYDNPLVAIGIGMTAGMAASGIESYRATYTHPAS